MDATPETAGQTLPHQHGLPCYSARSPPHRCLAIIGPTPRRRIAPSPGFTLNRPSPILAIALAYLLGRGLVWAWLLPPWQGPDEPGHAEMAVLVRRDLWPTQPDPAVQAPIVAAMDEARFHSWLQLPEPPPTSTRFSQLPRLADAPSQAGDESPLAYLPLALVAGAPPADAQGAAALLRRLRGASLTMAMLWLLALWAAGKAWGGQRPAVALVVLSACLPLGAQASATVGTDLAPAIAVLLWLACLPQPLGRGERTWPWRLLRLGLAVGAGLAKRSGLFLLPLAIGIELADQRLKGGPTRWRRGAWGSLGAFLVIVLLIPHLPRPDRADGWDREGRAWGAERARDAAYEGAWGLWIEDRDPLAWQYLFRWVSLPPSAAARELTLTAWVRGLGGQAAADFQVALTDGAGRWWGRTQRVSGPDWERFELRVILPPGLERLRLALVPGSGTAAGKGRFAVDDLRLSLGGRILPANGDAEAAASWAPAFRRAALRYGDPARLLRGLGAIVRSPWEEAAKLGRGLAFLLDSSWGGYGWLSVWPGPLAMGLGRVLGLFLAAAALLALLRPRALAGPWLNASQARICGLTALLALLVALAGSMLGAQDRLPQGRYLLAAWPGFALPGLALAGRLAGPRAILLMQILLLLLDLWTLFGVLWPAFGMAA